MATPDRQEMYLADLETMHRPATSLDVRAGVERLEGLERVLERRLPGDALRDAVVRRLGYETFLEVAAQAGMVPRELRRDDAVLSDLFVDGPPQPGGPPHRWLCALYARRVAGEHTLALPEDASADIDGQFFDFDCLRTSIVRDQDLDAFIAEITAPGTDNDDVILEPYASPATFLEVLGTPDGSPSAWASAHVGPSVDAVRLTRALVGLQRFLLLRLDLAEALRGRLPGVVRTAFWHWLAGWLGGYSGSGFTRALDLAGRAIAQIEAWDDRPDIVDEEPVGQRGVLLHAAAHRVLTLPYAIPRSWRRAAGVDRDTGESGGSPARVPPPPVVPLVSGGVRREPIGDESARHRAPAPASE